MRKKKEPVAPPQDDLVETALDFVAEMLRGLRLPGTVSVEGEDEREVAIRIVPDTPPVWLGEAKGRTIQAMQYLLNIAYGTQLDKRFHVRLEGFEPAPVDRGALADLVKDAVEKIEETGKRFLFEPMPSSRRKALHQLIADQYPDLQTYSTGEDPERRLVVEPKGPKADEIASWQGRGGPELKSFDARRGGVYRSRQPR